MYKPPANGSRRTELRSVSVSVSHTGGEDEGFFSFFLWETNVSRYFFLTHSPQPMAARGRLTTSPSHRREGALIINKRYAGS